MQAYSMDLRERALLDSDAGMKGRGRCGEVPRERVVGAAVEAASAGDGRSRAARGGAFVTSESISFRAIALTSSTASSNTASFAFDGLVNPLSFRTNCFDAARTSSSVAGGSKLKSVLMFRPYMIGASMPTEPLWFTLQ